MTIIYNYRDISIVREKAKFYASELWDLNFNIPIIFNGRLKTTMGLFESDRNNKPVQIELAKHIFDEYHDELIVDDTLLHELCHWACLIIGKNNKDGSRDFEKELRRVGANSTRSSSRGGIYHYGNCKKCGRKIIEEINLTILNRRLNTNCCISRCCHCQIIYGGTITKKVYYKPNKKLIELNNKFKEYWLNRSILK